MKNVVKDISRNITVVICILQHHKVGKPDPLIRKSCFAGHGNGTTLDQTGHGNGTTLDQRCIQWKPGQKNLGFSWAA